MEEQMMHIAMPLQVGEVIQLNPLTTANKMFAGCLMVITEIKNWGAQGYVQSLGNNGEIGGQAYYRASFTEIVKLENGLAPFIIE